MYPKKNFNRTSFDASMEAEIKFKAELENKFIENPGVADYSVIHWGAEGRQDLPDLQAIYTFNGLRAEEWFEVERRGLENGHQDLWVNGKFRYDTIHVPERKAHFIEKYRENMFFVAVSLHVKHYAIVCATKAIGYDPATACNMQGRSEKFLKYDVKKAVFRDFR